MTVEVQSVSFSVNKSLSAQTPDVLENWDVMAVAAHSYAEIVSNVTYTYIALDHYNFDSLEDALTLVCNLINLQIPGYSLIAVGVVAVITIGVIIKKKIKK